MGGAVALRGEQVEGRNAETGRRTPAKIVMMGTKAMAMVAILPVRWRSAGNARTGRVCRSHPTHRATMARRFAMGKALAAIACPLTWCATIARAVLAPPAKKTVIVRRWHV